LAVLALRFDCDVLPLRVERLDGAHFRVTVFPPLPLPRSGGPHAVAAVLMERVNATLGGVDPRPTGAKALGAPKLAGLADTIQSLSGTPGAGYYRDDPLL